MNTVVVTAGVSVTVTQEQGAKQSGFLKGEHKLFEEIKHEFGDLVDEVKREEKSIAERLEAELQEIEEIPEHLWDRIRTAIKKHVG